MNPFRAVASWIGGFFDKKLWTPIGGRKTTSLENVSEDSALNYSAVWCATRILCGTGASLPFPVYSGFGSDERSKARNHPLYRILNGRPNYEQTAYNFRSVMWQWQVNWGNAYAEIIREGGNPNGPLMELWPIHPSRVQVCRDENEFLYYKVKEEVGGSYSELDPWQMLHIPSIITHDGIQGHGVIEHARESIGAGIAAEKYGAHWFGGAAVPRAVVEHPGKWNPESRAAFRKEWEEIYSGPDGHRMALLEGGAKVNPLSLSAEDSQFLETRQFGVEEIARWYGIPPHMLQHLLRATFNNIEHLGINFVQYSLIPWLRIWEQCCWQKLLTEKEQEEYFCEHNVDALMRGDAASRASFYQTMTSAALMTRNEVRKLENLDPVEGGDTFLVQGAMVPLDEDGKPVSEFAKGPEPAAPDDDGEDDTDEGEDVTAIAKAVVSEYVDPMIESAKAERESDLEIFEEKFSAFRQNISDIEAQTAITGNDCKDLREADEYILENVRKNKIDSDAKTFAARKDAMAAVHQLRIENEGMHNDEREILRQEFKSIAEHGRKIFEDKLKWVLTKETHEVLKQCKTCSGFVSNVESFYSEWMITVSENILPHVGLLYSCGLDVDPVKFTTAWVNEGKGIVIELAGTVTSQNLRETAEKVLRSNVWVDRPIRAIERVSV